MGQQPAQSLLAERIYHRTYQRPVSVPITLLLYNGPLLCGFNVPVKGLNMPLPGCSSHHDVVYRISLIHRQQICANRGYTYRSVSILSAVHPGGGE